MAIRVDRPQVTVKLIKMVKRDNAGMAQRFTGANREMDLTPFLSENGGIKITKGLNEPAGGWQIAFADNVEAGILDTLSARIEPMDHIEIRGSRTPHLYAGRPLPLLTRGWVTAIRRAESMGGDGEPQRVVAIMGQDSGKLWQNFRLFSQAIYGDPAQTRFIETFRLQATQGMEVSYLPVSEALRQLTQRVMNRNLADMAAFSDQVVKPFKVDRIAVPDGHVSVNLIAPFQGAYWDLAERIADRPWNELFVEEEEDGPSVVFRPAPYRAIDRSFTINGAVDPGVIELDDRDVASLETGRSDQRVANFFYVPPGATMLDSSGYVNVASVSAGGPFDREYPNNDPRLYGLRMMQVASNLLPSNPGMLPAGLPEGQRQQIGNQMVEWHIRRARELKAMNRDNSVLEEGSASVIGSELLKPGRFVRITRGSVVSEFYCTKVSHSISPLDGWSASIALERGMGFLDRAKMPGSPYWLEGRKGPYA